MLLDWLFWYLLIALVACCTVVSWDFLLPSAYTTTYKEPSQNNASWNSLSCNLLLHFSSFSLSSTSQRKKEAIIWTNEPAIAKILSSFPPVTKKTGLSLLLPKKLLPMLEIPPSFNYSLSCNLNSKLFLGYFPYIVNMFKSLPSSKRKAGGKNFNLLLYSSYPHYPYLKATYSLS